MLEARLVGREGNLVSVDADGQLAIVPGDFSLELAKGNIPGHYGLNKFGRNPDIGTATDPEDVWDGSGLWVRPTTARVHDVGSGDANDDAAGTGAQAVRLWGLVDWHKAEVSEDIELAGASDVATVNSYVIIHRMKVIRWGAIAGVAAANILATAVTDATVTAQITVGNDQTLMAVYGVPALQTLYVTQWYLDLNKSGSAGSVDVDLCIDPVPDQALSGYQVKHHLGLQSVGSSHIGHPFNPYYPVPGPALVLVRVAEVSASGSDISAGFDGILVDN